MKQHKIVLLIGSIGLLITSLLGCTNTSNVNDLAVVVTVIDSCEYINYRAGYEQGLLTHKGNCKYCAKRNEQMFRELADGYINLLKIVESIDNNHSHIPIWDADSISNVLKDKKHYDLRGPAIIKKIAKDHKNGWRWNPEDTTHHSQWDLDLLGTNQGIGIPEMGNESEIHSKSFKELYKRLTDKYMAPIDSNYHKPRTKKIIFESDSLRHITDSVYEDLLWKAMTVDSIPFPVRFPKS